MLRSCKANRVNNCKAKSILLVRRRFVAASEGFRQGSRSTCWSLVKLLLGVWGGVGVWEMEVANLEQLALD